MTNKKDVLVYGAWIDPRSSGISSVQHDVIKEISKRGRRQYLITEDWNNPNPLAVKLTIIEPSEDFKWQEVVGTERTFESLEDLIEKDRKGEIKGRPILQNIGVVHSHSDDIIPHYNPNERHSRKGGHGNGQRRRAILGPGKEKPRLDFSQAKDSKT